MKLGDLKLEVLEGFAGKETMREVSRVSLRMSPALALVAVNNVLQDRQADKPLSNYTKMSVAGLVGTVVAGAAALMKS